MICGKAELCVFVVFLLFDSLFQNFARSSPEIHQSSSEFTRIRWNFTRISPDCCQNIELEHLKKGDNHNSAFQQRDRCLKQRVIDVSHSASCCCLIVNLVVIFVLMSNHGDQLEYSTSPAQSCNK